VNKETERIAKLNDLARTAMGVASKLVMTQGIAVMSAEDQSAIREKVERFDDFNADNDPYGERDCGVFDFGTVEVIWKVDYFDRALRFGSENPANPAVTRRVLTIMRADEY
jgi:hypothetical protein